MLRAHISDARALREAPTPVLQQNVCLQPVEQILAETFDCDRCGQQFATAAACKRHIFLVHLSEEEQGERQEAVKSHATAASASMAHAKQGMPWCRHCDRKFQNWPNFYYHISSLSCEGLRTLHQSKDFGLAIADMTEALVERPLILEQAKSCTWLDLANSPEVIKNVQHCPECHHWVATPQYLKRHMKAKHPELAQLVDDCTEFVRKSNVSITSPCRYCNVAFQRRDAHLRSCAGLFCGAFVCSRIARGPPLPFAKHGRVQDRSQGPGGVHTGTSDDRVSHPAGQPGVRTTPLVRHGSADGDHVQQASGPGNRTGAMEGRRRRGYARPSGAGPMQRARETPEKATRNSRTGHTQSLGAATNGATIGRMHRREGSYLKEIQALRHRMDLLTTLVLRHDNQLTIDAQDKSFMIFVRTDVEGNLGAIPLRGRATVERAENHIPREAHSSHAGDTHPEAAQRGCGPLQQDHGLRGQDLAGSTAGVGDRAGDAGGHEMGSGTSQACSERPVRPAGSCRGETTPSGYDSVECKPPGGESFPCNPANGRAVLFPHHELHDGCGTEDQGSWRNVASTQQAVPLLGMGDEWSLSSPCTVDEGHHGSARGTGSGRPEGSGQRQRAKGQPRRGETQILSSILINRSNHCYTNALVRSLQFLPVQCDSEGILPPKMGGLLKGFRAAAKPVVIWDNPFWKAVFGRWRNRDMQHDVADFLAHMIQCCPEMPSLLGVEWEARTSENGLIETRDRGCSLPLSVSPSSEVLSGRSMTTVQRVVDDWCRQEARHAAIVIPKVLVLQLGRFDRDAVGAVTRKWMYDIIPDRVLMFPVFDGEWGVTQVPMRLSSVIMHRGETPQTGHYRTILNVNDQLMLADDNCQIRLCEAGDLSAMNTDSYLFFYRLI